MAELQPALEGLDPAYLVGGAVRDLLLGGSAVDLDVAVEGDAVAVAEEVARRLGGTVRAHDRFGTATVQAGDVTVDLASTRSETYERPGALPEVAPAGLDEDLGRRDFTINAMAVGLTGSKAGELRDPHGGAADLEAGIVRVLHDASFVDDPTRLLRAVRYEARLGFAIDPDTERLARDAVRRARRRVGRARARRAARPARRSARRPPRSIGWVSSGIAAALHPASACRRRPGGRGPARQPGDGRGPGAQRARGAWHPTAPPSSWNASACPRRTATRRCGRPQRAPGLAEELAAPRRPSELHALLSPEPPEALALALAFGAPADAGARLRRPVCATPASTSPATTSGPRACPSRRRSARAGRDAAAQARRRDRRPARSSCARRWRSPGRRS